MASRSVALPLVLLLVGTSMAGCFDARSPDDSPGEAATGANGTNDTLPDTNATSPEEPGEPALPPQTPLPENGTRIHGVVLHDATGAILNATVEELADLGYPSPLATLQFGTGFSGAEPSIGFTDSGNLFFVAGTLALRSEDEGRTYEVVKRDAITADPLLWVDQDTSRVFVNQLWGGCSFMHFSDNEGNSWTSNPIACGLPVNDHQKMTTAPRVSSIPGAAYPNVVYYCASQVVQAQCAVSHDGGITWIGNRAVPTGECGGLHGMPWGANDGTVYLPFIGCDRPAVAVTSDEGLTWTVRHGPSVSGGNPYGTDPDIVATPDGTVYMVYTGRNHVAYLIRSTDQGENWDGPFRAAPAVVKSVAFVAIAAGADGRLGIAYVGSENHAGDPNEADESAVWNLYMTLSLDAVADRDALRFVTLLGSAPADPVQRGSICLRGITECGDDRNLLDFIDATVSPDGRFYAASGDGCTSQACIDGGGPESSRDDEGTTFLLDQGPNLLDAEARLPSLAGR